MEGVKKRCWVGVGQLGFDGGSVVGNSPTLIGRLVKEGAQVNYWDPELLQSTAVHWAATNGHHAAIRKLVELGGSISPTNQVATAHPAAHIVE